MESWLKLPYIWSATNSVLRSLSLSLHAVTRKEYGMSGIMWHYVSITNCYGKYNLPKPRIKVSKCKIYQPHFQVTPKKEAALRKSMPREEGPGEGEDEKQEDEPRGAERGGGEIFMKKSNIID